MADTHVVSALKDKRARIAGQITALEAEIGQRRADLLHIDATLRLFDDDIEPETIPPIRPRARNDWFAHGECLRRALSILRSSDPLPTGDIVRQLMMLKGRPTEDRGTFALVRRTVMNSLSRATETLERLSGGGPNKEVRWWIKG